MDSTRILLSDHKDGLYNIFLLNRSKIYLIDFTLIGFLIYNTLYRLMEGERRWMRKYPLVIVTGASGSGKTTVIPELYRLCPEHIVVDLDAMYPPLEDWKKVMNVWLTVADQLRLNSRLLVISGTIMPWHYEKLDLRNRFTPYYIGLHCSDQVRNFRLTARHCSEQVIQDHEDFNDWLINNAEVAFDPPMQLIDTSNDLPREVGRQIKLIIDGIPLEK